MVQDLIYFGCYIRKAMKNHAGLANKRIISKGELKFNSELWKQCADMTLKEDYLSSYRIPESGMTTGVTINT